MSIHHLRSILFLFSFPKWKVVILPETVMLSALKPTHALLQFPSAYSLPLFQAQTEAES